MTIALQPRQQPTASSAEVARRSKECPEGLKPGIHADGITVPKPGEKLSIEIVDVSRQSLQREDEFFVTIKVRNVGRIPVSIPWQQKNGHIPEGDGEAEIVIFGGILESKRNRDVPIGIKVDSDPLVGTPGVPNTYQQIKPGEWVAIKLRAALRCDGWNALDRCFKNVTDNDAKFYVVWREATARRATKDCRIAWGYFRKREIKSSQAAIKIRGEA